MDRSEPTAHDKIKIAEETSNITNKDLLIDIFFLCHGDGYDGYFTPIGRYRYNTYRSELLNRLVNVNYIKKSDIEHIIFDDTII